MPKILNDKDRTDFVLVDDLCKRLRVKKRKRISRATANNWIRALKLKKAYMICTDGKFRSALSLVTADKLIALYRERKAFKIGGKP